LILRPGGRKRKYFHILEQPLKLSRFPPMVGVYAMETTHILFISGGQPCLSAELPFTPTGWRVVSYPAAQALDELTHCRFDAVILEFPMPDWNPADLVESVQQAAANTPILMHDPSATPADAVRLARLGIYQFISDGEDALVQIGEAVEASRTRGLAQLATNIGKADWERLMVGSSNPMREVCHIIQMVGCRRSTVLITGETGTGKEIAARALHLAGPRRRIPLVAVNCSALPENLLEAELFGHVRGAFTGAVQNRVGRFEQAQGGTLFLDEIGELPMDIQAKLLRVLQEREYQRLGSSETMKADVRVVAATNCNLLEKIDQGKFREDLYYRLNVVPLQMPPLRERRSDIPMLAEHFVEKICRFEGIPRKSINPEAISRLTGYSWPGNVRQLENAIEMAVALSGERHYLIPSDFASCAPVKPRCVAINEMPSVSIPDDGLDYESTLAGIERSILEQALRKTGGNKKLAADMLRLKRTTLSAKVRTLDAAGLRN
jgi:DNA-binding NtrC family response regulator